MQNAKNTTRREFLETGAALGASLVLAGCGREGRRPERGARGGGAVGASRPPNILFFLSDQHRHDWLQMNPAVPVPTPHLAALAARGAHFRNALVASPLCGPSRACLASGVEFERCGVATNQDPYPAQATSYYKRLRESGYHVMGVGKLDLGRSGQRHREAWGFSAMVNCAGKSTGMQSFRRHGTNTPDPYYRYLGGLTPPLGKVVADDMYARLGGDREHAMDPSEPVPIADRHYLDNWIARSGLQLLEAAPSGAPWHLVVNFAGPHTPNDITRRMARRYRGPERVVEGFPQPDRYQGSKSPEWHVGCRQNYSAMIENIDQWIGRYVEILAGRGELDDTLVVYSSDHGEMLGDRSLRGKSVPYQASVGVPLVLAGPGIRGGVVTDVPVSLIDLNATFLDFAGLPAASGTDSVSLRPYCSGDPSPPRKHVFSAVKAWRLVDDGRYKLVSGYGERDLLFDRQADPFETRDLAGELPEQAALLREELEGRG